MANNPQTEYQDAVIYARYSSHSQRDVSIEQQIRSCEKFADRHGLRVVHVYEDRALTGTSDKRPGFQRMIRDAGKSEWKYVIVYTLDRFARDRYDSAVYKRQLKNAGVKVLSAMENISDDPTGVLMESLLEGLAEYYSKELSRKIRRGMDDNASKCLCNGQIPFGYRRGEDGRFAIDDQEAPIVQEIYRKIRDGAKLSELIHSINARGIRNKRGNRWTYSTFNALLSNERYTGVYIYKDIRIPGGMPQIIEPALFQSVQVILHTKKNPRKSAALSDAERSALPQRRRQDNGIYYLTGKLFCGHCHSPMVGISGHSKNGPSFYYYTCKGKRTNHTCQKKNVRREFIEEFIAHALKETMLTDDAILALSTAAIEYQSKCVTDLGIESLQQQLSDVKRSISNLMAAIEAGIFSATTQARLTELESTQRDLTHRLSVAKAEAETQLTREDIITCLKMFQNGDVCDPEFRELMIDTFLVAAYVYDNEIKIVFNLSGKKKSAILPFNIEGISLSDPSTENCKLHQTVLYEHFGHPVIMIGDLFVFSKTI